MKYFTVLTVITLLTYHSSCFASSYTTEHSDEWQFSLLTETCAEELEAAIAYAAQKISQVEKIEKVFPKTIGYQYFKIEFRSPTDQDGLTYEFQYWSKNDEHTQCTRVDPLGFVY